MLCVCSGFPLCKACDHTYCTKTAFILKRSKSKGTGSSRWKMSELDELGVCSNPACYNVNLNTSETAFLQTV